MSAVFFPWLIALVLCAYAVIVARKKKYPENFEANEQKKARRVLLIASAVLIAASLYRIINIIVSLSSGDAGPIASQDTALEVIGASLFLVGSISYFKGTHIWQGNSAMFLRRFGYLNLIIFIIVSPGGFQVLLPLIIILSIPWSEINESKIPAREV